MNHQLPSLLAGGAQAEMLAVLDELPDGFWEGDEAAKDLGVTAALYTADRFFSKRPEDYKRCVALLAAGAGLLKIARLLKVHHKTVAAVRDREGAEVDIQKEGIKRNVRLAVEIAAERLPDVIAALSGSQLPIATAVLIDKLAQLDGEPTQRVLHTFEGHLTHDAVMKNITAFPDAIDLPATGSEGRESGQKALPVLVVEAAPIPAATLPGPAAG